MSRGLEPDRGRHLAHGPGLPASERLAPDASAVSARAVSAPCCFHFPFDLPSAQPPSPPSRSVGRGVVPSAETPKGSGHETGKIRIGAPGHSDLSTTVVYTRVVDGKLEDAMKGLYGPLVDRAEEKNGCESYRIAEPLSYTSFDS